MTSSTSGPHKGQGHRKRLRDKFLSSGLSGFHDYEVIELLLTLATPRKDCKASAKILLKKFKTLQKVFEASDADLCTVPGVGPSNLLGIRLIKAVAARYLEKKLMAQKSVHNSKELFEYLNHSIADKTHECFVAVFLDAKNKVIKAEMLFQGTLTATSVYPREVVRAALDNHAAALIFAHNHPSGDPEPSAEDISITRRLVFACGLMDIAVHEHLVMGTNAYFSFADHGQIQKMNQEFKQRIT